MLTTTTPPATNHIGVKIKFVTNWWLVCGRTFCFVPLMIDTDTVKLKLMSFLISLNAEFILQVNY